MTDLETVPETGTTAPETGTTQHVGTVRNHADNTGDPDLKLLRPDTPDGPFDTETHVLVRWTHTVDNPRGRPHLPPTRRSSERITRKVHQVPGAYRMVPRELWDRYQLTVIALTTLDRVIATCPPPTIEYGPQSEPAPEPASA